MFVNNSCLPNSMNCIIAQLNGVGGIYLGNLDPAQNSELLSKYQIGAVLSVIDQSIQIRSAQKLWIMADDCEDFQLYKYFDQAIKFIEYHSLKTNILIHCYAGISRSAAICAAYMMQKYKWNLNQTLRNIQQRGRFINPNSGFIKQLQVYDQKMKTKQQDKIILFQLILMRNLDIIQLDMMGIQLIQNAINSINNQIFNQTIQQNQRNRLSDLNVKLSSYLHKWKIRERELIEILFLYQFYLIMHFSQYFLNSLFFILLRNMYQFKNIQIELKIYYKFKSIRIIVSLLWSQYFSLEPENQDLEHHQ